MTEAWLATVSSSLNIAEMSSVWKDGKSTASANKIFTDVDSTSMG